MIKRLFDILASSMGLLLLSPLLAAIAVAIWIDSPGPILFRQTRVGRNGVPFRIHKFRTMRSAPGEHGRQITVGADPRITGMGHHLRRYKLDELPQLFDVLRGRMSIVGPRPEVPRYVDLYPAEVRDQVLSIRPGITDRSSILFRDEADLLAGQADPDRYYIEHVLPIKLGHHLDYLKRSGLREDLKIVFETLRVL